MKSFLPKRLKAFTDSTGWLLVAIGLLLFMSRMPLEAYALVNLPLAVTAIQTAGLMFAIAGIQIFISRMMWPNIKYSEVLEDVKIGQSMSSALLLFGLFVYNGLCTIAFVIWLVYAMGAGLR